jgi:Lrp/AsnC family leucine-responsive transcriptional regulator
MAAELDKIDLQILKTLQENGRITNLQLSTEIGLSPAPTLSVCANWKMPNTLRVTMPWLMKKNWAWVLKPLYRSRWIFIRKIPYKLLLTRYRQIKEVTECHHVTGQCDFLLKVYVRDIKSYEQLIMEKISRISVVKTFQTMMIMSTSKKEPIVPLGILSELNQEEGFENVNVLNNDQNFQISNQHIFNHSMYLPVNWLLPLLF